MKRVIFTDTHFGVRQNSITWLNSQKRFIYEQFIPYIKKLKEPVEIIHLGDVFDSRSSISTLIASEVVNIFNELSDIDNVEIISIIAGNHDFYSPNSDKIDSINLLLSNIKKLSIYTNRIERGYDCLYIPWYEWFKEDKIQNLINEYNIKYIFTHADIVKSAINVKGPKVFSGHTHIPLIKGNIYNLGSCFPLDFGDSNSPRGFYVLYDDDRLEFIENEKSIRFWRLFNNDIFKDINIGKDDYIELYIDQSNLSKSDVSERINYFMDNYKNIRTIPQLSDVKGIKLKDFKGYDIENIINEFIPDNLKKKFEKVVELRPKN